MHRPLTPKSLVAFSSSKSGAGSNSTCSWLRELWHEMTWHDMTWWGLKGYNGNWMAIPPPQKNNYVFLSLYAMQQLCECACRSSKHRAHAFVFGKAPQSVDIDIVQVWSSEEDGSFEACWTLCVFTHIPLFSKLASRKRWTPWQQLPSEARMIKVIRDFNQHLNSSFCILHGMNILRFLVVFMGLILSLAWIGASCMLFA